MDSESRATLVVELASEQSGLVTSRQARAAASVTPQQIKRMADSGMLQRLHHGIYRLAHVPDDKHLDKRLAWVALDPEQVIWDRLDQDVPTGVLSHRSAAEMYRLGDLDADVVELTATRRIRLSLPNVTVHRGHLSRDDWQIVDGLPVTNPVRTIGDLAATSTDAGHLATVVRDALTRDLATTEEVVSVLAPHAFDYGHRPLDGQVFLDALIEQAGVPATTLAVADIARKIAGATPSRELVSSQQSIAAFAPMAAALAPQMERLNAEVARAITPLLKAQVTRTITPALEAEVARAITPALEAIRHVATQLNSPELEAARAAAAQIPSELETMRRAAAQISPQLENMQRAAATQLNSPELEAARAAAAQISPELEAIRHVAAQISPQLEAIRHVAAQLNSPAFQAMQNAAAQLNSPPHEAARNAAARANETKR
ncbi:type IV toxin-antitoxin system AbiEi family antitoxin domain-containing protein (plasmid) [Nocardia pseudovaccinii]|uniref:type IV toxin-antitoxin system AbiEi family antitoxin domain-containing protein n=1 Tax=Nocardia pseudovaccinii TaxID=189540 RepID=UPI003D90E6FC